MSSTPPSHLPAWNRDDHPVTSPQDTVGQAPPQTSQVCAPVAESSHGTQDDSPLPWCNVVTAQAESRWKWHQSAKQEARKKVAKNLLWEGREVARVKNL